MISSAFLKNKVLHVTPETFDALALEIFHYQAQNNPVYQAYLTHLKRDIQSISRIEEIPFLPIEFFKTQEVLSGQVVAETIFESSGTTGQTTSRHLVADPAFYLQIAEQIFERFYGKLHDFQVLALLPSYLERSNSSLVYMVEHFIRQSGSEQSGFYLHNYEELITALRDAMANPAIKKVLLMGVTFGLLDFAELGYDLSFLTNSDKLIVMETGGMKGRRKELLREEVHAILTEAFHVNAIHSEYGMTELLSQGYSYGKGVFDLPPSMKILLRDVNDPFSLVPTGGRSGGINVIDLANIDSCAFIETKDLGTFIPNSQQFSVLGRFDNSDVRGCNLMVGA
jgi:hypothetical protein